MVSNHSSYLDTPLLNLAFSPSFCPTLGLKSVPFFGRILQCVSCIFIPRGSSDEEKNRAIDAISDRVVQNSLEPSLPPLIIFPEGGTGTNSGLVSFKRGAFTAEKPIKPVFMKFFHNGVTPALTMGLNSLMFMQLSRGPILVSINVLPDFHPNEFLFQNHKKGSEDAENNENTRWKSYGWAVRDAMVKAG